jgi:hypothetical protein
MSADLVLLAHPLTETVVLPVPPVAVAGIAASLVVIVASFGSVSSGRAGLALARTTGEPLSWAGIAGRTVAVLVVLAAVVVGRIGPADVTRNLAPVLVVAVGVALLGVVSLAVGPVWSRIDPFDGLARLLRAPDDTEPGAGGAVWPAVVPALGLVYYLFAYPPGLRPRTLALALGVYTLLTVAGCLALGRRRWLEQVEPIGLLYTWFGGAAPSQAHRMGSARRGGRAAGRRGGRLRVRAGAR